MKSKNYVGLAGAFLVMVGGLCPLVHLPIIGNWNYWSLHTGLAAIVYVVAFLGALGAVRGRSVLLKIMGVIDLLLVLLTYLAIHLKVNDSFSFIPLKKLARVAAGLIHYQYLGWSLLLLGSLLMIIGGRKRKASLQ